MTGLIICCMEGTDMMPTRPRISWITFALVLAVTFLSLHGQAWAKAYPSNECASGKLKAAADYCDKTLKAWSVWDRSQNDFQRVKRLGKASERFIKKWTRADDRADSRDVDCTEMTLSS